MSRSRVDLSTSSAVLLHPTNSLPRSGSRRVVAKGSDETDGAVETAECFVAFGGHPSQ